MQPRQHRLGPVGIADDDRQMLDTAVGRPEGEDPRVLGVGQRHLRRGHRRQRLGRRCLVGHHVRHVGRQQVPVRRQRVGRDRRHHRSRQQPGQLGERHRAALRRARRPLLAVERPAQRLAQVRRGIGERPRRGAIEPGGQRHQDRIVPGRPDVQRPRPRVGQRQHRLAQRLHPIEHLRHRHLGGERHGRRAVRPAQQHRPAAPILGDGALDRDQGPGPAAGRFLLRCRHDRRLDCGTSLRHRRLYRRRANPG